MTLISPGIEVSVINESAYVSADNGTVPLIILATAENKEQPSNAGTAQGTTAATAGDTYLITSQRDLITTFGTPTFYQSSSGTMLHGYELNEYGLQAAYSYLGVSNRAYILRADVDLSELAATSVEPAGDPADGTYWLNTGSSTWGLREFNGSGYVSVSSDRIHVITDTSEVVDFDGENYTPISSLGVAGNYAVSAVTADNTVYYKNSSSNWVAVGTGTDTTSVHAEAVKNASWASSWPTITGTSVSPTIDNTKTWDATHVNNDLGNDLLYIVGHGLQTGDAVQFGDGAGGTTSGNLVDGTTYYVVYVSVDTFKLAASYANAIAGTPTIFTLGAPDRPAAVLTRTVFINGQEVLLDEGTSIANFATDVNAVFSGGGAGTTGLNVETSDSVVKFFACGSSASDGTTPNGAINIGLESPTVWADLGIAQGNHYIPAANQSAVQPVASLNAGDTRTAGSVWQDLNLVDLDISSYSSGLDQWNTVDTSFSSSSIDSATSTYGLPDARSISLGQVFVLYYPSAIDARGMNLTPFVRETSYPTTVTGSSTSPTFTPAETFTLNGTTITLSGATAAATAADIVAASITDVFAQVEPSGALSIIHQKGGDLIMKDTSGTPLADAGITSALANVYLEPDNDLVGTNWSDLTYESGTASPTDRAAEGTLWYRSVLDADIMINNAGTWVGYQTVGSDYRGWDLSVTDDAGPIVAASQPTTQSDGTALVSGDLWIDTSDLENYPVIRRYNSSLNTWTLLDNSDQQSSNGVVFADARWQTEADATAQVATTSVGTPSSIVDLLTDNFLDPDAPDAALYPSGILLFNTRRSGYNVKEYRRDVVTTSVYPSGNPRFSADDVSNYYPDRWVSKAGNQDNGAGYFGRKSQRRVIVAAMKSVIDSSTDIREEQRAFNLIAAPGYPELIANMNTLNIDRKETAHVVADTPFRLATNAANLQTWSQNANAATDNGEDGLVTNSDFMSVYYPSGQTNDLNGNSVVVPASHMILRTMAYNDRVGYPWFAAAGVNRGKITNASSIGYIDAASGEFQSIAVQQGLRDVLYSSNINPITFINGSGLMNYGNKTRSSVSSSIDRVNVSRLVAYMRTQLHIIAQPFVFQPNDELTRNEVKGVVESFCNDLLVKRALNDYLVVCDSSNNTNARIDRSELWIDVAIEPIKAIEFIYIPIRLSNTGEIANLS